MSTGILWLGPENPVPIVSATPLMCVQRVGCAGLGALLVSPIRRFTLGVSVLAAQWVDGRHAPEGSDVTHEEGQRVYLRQ